MQMAVPAGFKRHFFLKECGPDHKQSTFFVVIPLNYGLCRCQRDSNPPLRLPDGNTCCPCFSCQHSTISSRTLPGKKVASCGSSSKIIYMPQLYSFFVPLTFLSTCRTVEITVLLFSSAPLAFLPICRAVEFAFFLFFSAPLVFLAACRAVKISFFLFFSAPLAFLAACRAVEIAILLFFSAPRLTSTKLR